MQLGFGPQCIRLVTLTPAEAAQASQLNLLPGVAPAEATPRPSRLDWARFWVLPD